MSTFYKETLNTLPGVGILVFVALFILGGSMFVAPSSAFAVCPAGTHDSNLNNSNRGGAENCVSNTTGAVVAVNQQAQNDPHPINLWDWIGDPTLGNLFKWVAAAILTLVNWLLVEASFLFNFVMLYGVFKFSTIIGGSAGLHAAWSVLRDVGNILLLFGFIFMGIGTILNLHHFNAKTALPSLIIFAVLLNFSLFAAGVIIDSSNLLSSTFYKQVAGQGCEGTNITSCQNVGISTLVLKMSGINTENGFPQNGGVPQNVNLGNNTMTAVAYLGLALFNIVAAFVIGAGAIMLAIRAITLTFLMVLSPIGFAGMAIPLLHEQANDWWERIINQSFFAPIYILLIFVSLKIMESVPGAIGANNQTLLAAAFTGRPDSIGIMLIYVLTIGFMIGSLMVAKSMGAYGADFATKTSGNMTFGALGFAGRRFIGAPTNWAANKVASTTWARKNPFQAGIALGLLDKGARSSFDFRSSALGKSGAGLAELDAGKPNKDASHGYHGIEEKAVKAKTDFADRLSQTDREAAAEKAAKEGKKDLEKEKKAIEADWKTQQADLAAKIADAVARGDKPGENRAKADLAKAQATYQTAIKGNTEAIGLLDDTISKNNAANVKRQYANTIEHRGIPWPSVDRHANHEAAQKILKKLNRGDNEKLEDAIRGLEGKLSSGGGGGGGGGGAKKASGGGGGGGGH